MPVNVKLPWTRNFPEWEQHLLCGASLSKAPSGRVCYGQAPEQQPYRHRLRDGWEGPVSPWSFPRTVCNPCLSACQAKCKARAAWGSRRALQKKQPFLLWSLSYLLQWFLPPDKDLLLKVGLGKGYFTTITGAAFFFFLFFWRPDKFWLCHQFSLILPFLPPTLLI